MEARHRRTRNLPEPLIQQRDSRVKTKTAFHVKGGLFRSYISTGLFCRDFYLDASHTPIIVTNAPNIRVHESVIPSTILSHAPLTMI